MQSRTRRMQITCNNPIEKGITSDKIKETIELRWKTEYYCFCYETGEQGTYHVHIYIKFKNPQAVNVLSKAFGNAHVEVIRNSTIIYAKREHIWIQKKAQQIIRKLSTKAERVQKKKKKFKAEEMILK